VRDSRFTRWSTHIDLSRASGSIFTSIHPLLKHQIDEMSHHGTIPYIFTYAHTRVCNTGTYRKTAHEYYLCSATIIHGIILGAHRSRYRLWLHNQKLPGTRFRLANFYIFCRQIVLVCTAGDFNILVAAAIFLFKFSRSTVNAIRR